MTESELWTKIADAFDKYAQTGEHVCFGKKTLTKYGLCNAANVVADRNNLLYYKAIDRIWDYQYKQNCATYIWSLDQPYATLRANLARQFAKEL